MNTTNILIWICSFLLWLAIGIILYHIIEPQHWYTALGWVILWQVVTFVVDIVLMAIFIIGKELIVGDPNN